MMTLFIEGALLGLTLATFFGFGPAFFSLVQTSIHRGFGSAAAFAAGIFLNDLLMVVLCLMGSIQIVTEPSNYLWFGLSSGIILIIFGLVTYSRKVVTEVTESDVVTIKVNGPHWLTFVIKGFFMNVVTPFVWIFWVGVVVGISARFGGNEQELVVFFSGTLIIVLISDLFKAYGAFSIKRFFTPAMIRKLNKTSGIGLIAFGLYLITRVLIENT